MKVTSRDNQMICKRKDFFKTIRVLNNLSREMVDSTVLDI